MNVVKQNKHPPIERDEISSLFDEIMSVFKMQMRVCLLATLRRNSLGIVSRP